MVTRNITQLQKVTQVAAGRDPNLAETARVTFKKVSDATNASKIQKNISSAQLEIDNLTQQYRLGNESDPYGGQEGFEAERTAILNRFGEDIPSMYSNAWNAEAQNLTNRSATANNTWAFKQSQINTVNNINETIQTNLEGAASAGRIFGSSTGSDIGDILNFQASRERLSEFGNRHLGETKTNELLSSHDSDYVKTYMGGVIETNPIKANELLKNEKVRKTIGEGYGKLKTAALNKIDNLGKAKSQQEVLDVMGAENTLLRESANRNLSPVELEQVFSQNPTTSEGAKNYIRRINGYSSKKVKKTPSQKLAGKVAHSRKMMAFMDSDKSKTAEDYSKAQSDIYTAMDNQYITAKEGLTQLEELIEPHAENISNDISKFNTDYLGVDTSMGFDRIVKYFDDNIEFDPFGIDPSGVAVRNNRNQIDLYGYYYDSLTSQAQAKGIPLAGLGGISALDKQKMLDTAYDSAVTTYAARQGLGNFETATDATQALNRDTQQRLLRASQDAIDSAYADPKPTKEVDDFLEEFGL